MSTIDNIKAQFIESTGYKGPVSNDDFFNREFNDWLYQRVSVLTNYLYLLEELDINYDDVHTVEVGKSCYDSIVLPFNTSIITLFSEGFEVLDRLHLNERLHFGDMVVYNSVPRLVFSNKKEDYVDIHPVSINTFMTQNPYSMSDVYNWDQLHNSGVYNIVLGIYGNNWDRDKNKKIKSIINFKNELTPDTYKECYFEHDGEYFYIIASVNKKDKTLIREK